jgi:hypothetical protein
LGGKGSVVSALADFPKTYYMNKPQRPCHPTSVYYLRSCLINATMRPKNGLGWEFSSRFSHNKGITYPTDFGFHNVDIGDSGFGSPRSNKFLARKLFDPTIEINKRFMLQHPETSVWGPAQSTYDSEEN